MGRPTMNVSQVLAELKWIEAEGGGKFKVHTEGCDCTGDVGSVVVEKKSVLLKRP